MRKIYLSIILLGMSMLTGCVQLVEMTDREGNIIAEYMAGTVLKYSGYEDTLIYPAIEEKLEVEEVSSGLKQPEEAMEPTETAVNHSVDDTKQEENVAQSQEASDVDSIDKIIGYKDFTINYSDFEVLDNYPGKIGETYFNLEPSNGNKLLLAKFTVKNLSQESKNFNLVDLKLMYILNNSSDNSYTPMLTLLTNDLQFINVDIAAGELYNAVVVFDIPKDMDTSNISLRISSTDKNTTIAMN